MGRLIDWWRRRRLTKPRIDQVRQYESLPDVPERLGRHVLAACGPEETPKWAAFECPCGRGHRIAVTLQPSHRPRWSLEVSDGGPTLRPSVDFVGEFRCHYVLRDGRITWAKNSRPS